MPPKIEHRHNRTPASAAHSLSFAEWPDVERTAWEQVLRPRRKFIHARRTSRLSEETRKDLLRRYGQFLNFCSRTGRLNLSGAAGSLVTPDAVTGFIAELQSRVRSVTVARSIYKVFCTARLIDPERDFSWLAEIAKDLELLAEPMNKSGRVVMTERLVEAGLALVAEAELSTSRPLLTRSRIARNGLMVALLALCPIRLKNFVALNIGRSIVKYECTWWIVLDEEIPATG